LAHQRQFASEERIRRKLPRQIFEEPAGAVELTLAFGGKGEQGLRQWPQVTTPFRGHLKLLHSTLAVPVHSPQPQEHALVDRLAADNIVRHPERDIGVQGLRAHRQQPCRLLFGAPDESQARELMFLDHGFEVALHPVGEGEDEEAVRVLGSCLQALLGHPPGTIVGGEKRRAPYWVGLSPNTAEQSLVVEEELGCQDTLAVELLEEIACRLSGRPERIIRMRTSVGRDLLPSLVETEFVHSAEGSVELRFGLRVLRRHPADRDGSSQGCSQGRSHGRISPIDPLREGISKGVSRLRDQLGSHARPAESPCNARMRRVRLRGPEAS
jgi:hypothetical protein